MLAPLLAAVILQQPMLPPVIPQPAKIVRGLGNFVFDQNTRFAADGQARKVVERFRSRLSTATGFELPYTAADGENVVALRLRPQLAHLGREGYAMEVSPSRIRVEAPSLAGLFYATQTLRQLLPNGIELEGPHRRQTWRIPALVVEDSPRFEWRGLHLDESRHFFGKEAVKRALDQLALLKMNVFHWHLVDDGGWRIEIKKYPRLTQVGAWRKVTEEMWSQTKLSFPERQDKSPRYGGFYTQDDIREIVAYARDRFITVVPEIEMPGHSMPALAAYPDVSCTYFAQSAWRTATGMNHPTNYCPGKERTFKFLEGVLDEVMALFPSKVIHIGGDEVDKYQWSKCADCQKRMAAERLEDVDKLQSWFLHRIETYLNKKGRSMMGWDEILEGGLAPNAQVMSWRGEAGGIAAAKQGHDVVMSPTSHCYFDYSYQSISTRTAFEYEPVPPSLTQEEGKRVRGAQANVWTEWMADWQKVESMVFPRILGLAERLWGPKENRDAEAFLARADTFLQRLDALDIAYHVPVPSPNFAAFVFPDAATLQFAPVPMPGGVVRFTTDGTVPTPDSHVFEGPTTFDRSLTVTAATFTSKQRRSDPVAIALVKFQPISETGLQAGLWLRHATGTWDRVPDLPVETPRPVPTIDPSPYLGADHYALEWSGFLKFPSDGEYTFRLTSDDGSILWLAGVKAVDNDGLHGSVEKVGRIQLKAGVYPFRLGFFEAAGADSMTLTVEGPGFARAPIPAEWFWRRPN